jgi:hypothetical protein
MQVVTNENMMEFIEHRKVPEFVPPTDAKPKESETAEPQKAEPARGEDGKFVKAEEAVKTEVQTKEEKAAQAAVTDEEGDADLPERVRRQIGRKHRAMKEAEEFARERDAEAAREKQRADALEREIQALKGTKSGPAPAKSDGAPKPEDFKTVAEYADALTDWKLEEKLKARDEADAKKQQEQAAQRLNSEFSERIAKAMKEIPDYEDVVSASDQIVPPVMAQYIRESELGPLLGYHFAKHPEELERLSKLSPMRSVAELGKLETKLEKKPEKTPAPATVSRAPSPITPIDSSSSSTVTKDPSKMTFQELRAHRQAERASGKRA